MQKTVIIWVLAAALSFWLSRDTARGTEQPASVEGARKEGKLMIYSLLAVPDHSVIVNRFKERYPFIEVSLNSPGSKRENYRQGHD